MWQAKGQCVHALPSATPSPHMARPPKRWHAIARHWLGLTRRRTSGYFPVGFTDHVHPSNQGILISIKPLVTLNATVRKDQTRPDIFSPPKSLPQNPFGFTCCDVYKYFFWNNVSIHAYYLLTLALF